MREKRSYLSLTPSSLTPSNLLIGEKLLIYIHPARYNVFDNFWWALINKRDQKFKSVALSFLWKGIKTQSGKLRLSLEGCKVCKNADCTDDSLQIIENACFDSLQLGCRFIGYLPFSKICSSVIFYEIKPYLDILKTVVFINVDATFTVDNNQWLHRFNQFGIQFSTSRNDCL